MIIPLKTHLYYYFSKLNICFGAFGFGMVIALKKIESICPRH
jgi:hypothetical protein